MKNYIKEIEKNSFFINNFIHSYNTLIKNKNRKNNYNKIIKSKEVNKYLTSKDIINHFSIKMKKDIIYNNYKILKDIKNKNSFIIIKENLKTEDFFEVVEINFNIRKGNTLEINNIKLAKELSEKNIIININIEREFIELYIRGVSNQIFGMAKLSFFNNKVDKGEILDDIEKISNFKELLKFFNEINNIGYKEEIIDFLILNKNFTKEELELYLIAYDLDFKKELENPLRVKFKENNKMLIKSKKNMII